MVNKQAYALGADGCQIRDITAYGQKRAAIVGKENVFDYSIGNPSIPTPPAVTQALLDILKDTPSTQIHSYTSAQGDFATRQAIADDLNQRYDCQITPEELFMGCGASGELVSIFHALATKGSEIIAIAPYFPEYQPFVEQSGAAFRIIPADLPNFQIRLDLLEAAITPNTAAIIINSPNNPAGTVYTEETLRALAELLTRKAKTYGHPIYIVSDDPYRELTYDGVITPFLPNIYKDTIVCYSYSKSLSLPGERIGYIYVPKEATDAEALFTAIIGAARATGHICAPALMQKVLARCAHLKPDLAAYDKNRKTLYEGLIQAGYQVAKPEGAFYLFVKAPDGDSQAFCKRAMEKDLLVVPGDSFGCPEYFRLCYCVSYETIVRSLPVFRELMK